MRRRLTGGAAAFAAVVLLSGFQAPGKPADALAGVVKTYLGMGLPIGWEDLGKLPGFKWAAQTTDLKNCLPDGGCYTLQGTASLGGQSLTVVATGARTMVLNIYFRNTARAIGETAVLSALKTAGLSADLARCPVRAGVGGTNWYRLKGQDLASAFLSIQPPTAQRPTEGFVLSYGDELPQLQPNQVALYSEQCGAGATRQPVSTMKPHEALADAVVSLLAQASGSVLTDWKAFAALPNGITWDSTGPKKVDRAVLGDPNPMMLSGYVSYGGRKFSTVASGTPAQIKTIFFDEQGMHPRGEHMLGVVYEKGVAVKLVRCGPVYTESTHMWYGLTSPKTSPAMIRQSIRYDGNQVQDTYELRLDGTLPTRDPRDRNPGSNGC